MNNSYYPHEISSSFSNISYEPKQKIYHKAYSREKLKKELNKIKPYYHQNEFLIARRQKIIHDSFRYDQAKNIIYKFSLNRAIRQKIFKDYFNIIIEKLRISIDKVYFQIDFSLDSKLKEKIYNHFSLALNNYIYLHSNEINKSKTINLENFKRFCRKQINIKFEEDYKKIQDPENFYIFSNLNADSFFISDKSEKFIKEDLKNSEITYSNKTYILKKYKITDRTRD